MPSSRAKRRRALPPRNKRSCRLLTKLVYFVEQMATNSGAERMARLGIRDVDLKETFARSRGPGGQNVNKVATAVTLRHQPSGISVTVQDSRSQAQNRKLARERLLDAIEGAHRRRRAAEIAERERARRRKSARPAALKRKILESKRKRGELKKQRARIDS
jgi:peptide chain release factor